MNYYKRHLGDYAKDTGHLTALEHGVYTLLLDWYYSNERPIPEGLSVRIARGNPEETETVLREFFELTAIGWIHHYADRVIAEYNAKAATNRESGKLGGRPKRTVSERLAKETLAISHKPLAISHKESKAVASPRGSRLPADWFPSDEQKSYAETQGVNVSLETENFRDYWHAKAGKDACKTDWGLTWKTWVRRAPKGKAASSAQPVAKSSKEAMAPSETPLERKKNLILHDFHYGKITETERDSALSALERVSNEI